MVMRAVRHAAGMLLLSTLSGCLGWLLPAGPEPSGPQFVVIRRELAWTGSLSELMARAQKGLARQGAVLESADTERAKYELAASDQPAWLLLRRSPSGVSMKVVAPGPYVGALALRVSACTKALRRAAAEGATTPATEARYRRTADLGGA
jgi:hypothetical protein